MYMCVYKNTISHHIIQHKILYYITIYYTILYYTILYYTITHYSIYIHIYMNKHRRQLLHSILFGGNVGKANTASANFSESFCLIASAAESEEVEVSNSSLCILTSISNWLMRACGNPIAIPSHIPHKDGAHT